MPDTSLLKKLLSVDLAVVESARIDEKDGSLVVEARPRKSQLCRCHGCGKKAPSKTCRRRRADGDLSTSAPRGSSSNTSCPASSARVAGPARRPSPRTEHASRLAREFEEQVTWLAAHASKKAAAALMRIDRKSVGGICKRVCDRLDGQVLGLI